jgi:hypothetical protein
LAFLLSLPFGAFDEELVDSAVHLVDFEGGGCGMEVEASGGLVAKADLRCPGGAISEGLVNFAGVDMVGAGKKKILTQIERISFLGVAKIETPYYIYIAAIIFTTQL